MPKAKVVDRQRVLQACATCKRRKEKCDGLQPCANCKKQHNQAGCIYLDSAPRSGSRQPPTTTTVPHSRNSSLVLSSNFATASSQDTLESLSIESCYTSAGLAPSTISAPVSELPRFLQDPGGRSIYIGDSATLSFLQTVRRIVDSSMGPCQFTSDPLRHQLIETNSSLLNTEDAGAGPLPDINEALDLMRDYFVAVSGALDLFDVSTVTADIHDWIAHPMRSKWPNCSIFYLVLALGAQGRGGGLVDDRNAEQYFTQGRSHATVHLVDNPSLSTVQAFCMITWYMLTGCRQNAALMNLGIAVQAAYAIGVHRQEANAAFGTQVAALRERAWKTLRVCDLFLSASMGRPSLTSRIDSNVSLASLSISNPNNRLSSSMSRICMIFERILSEVYSHRAVSLDLASSISGEHRRWTEELPGMLEADGISSDPSGPVDLAKTLGSAIVVMAYYYSIVLLTRPFLTFNVDSYVKNQAYESGSQGSKPGVATYSDACINSAVKGIELARHVIRYEDMPRRIPLIVNSVFISALVLGLACFGDYSHRGWALEQTLGEAIAVLSHFGACSPQSARYQHIIELLRNAAVSYKDIHWETTMETRKERIKTVFGTVAAQLDRRQILAGNPSIAYQSSADCGPSYEAACHSRIHPSSLFSTSGRLAANFTTTSDLHHNQNPPGGGTYGADSGDILHNVSSDTFLADEVPLFDLMKDYNQ